MSQTRVVHVEIQGQRYAIRSALDPKYVVAHVAADHAYAEFGRRFQVRGTSDRREETVFLGYRQLGGIWRLREVRIAP